MIKSTMDLIASIRPSITQRSDHVVPQQDREELLNSILRVGIVAQPRHRRPVLIGAVAAGVAAVVLTAVAVTPHGGGAATGQVQDAAYLVDHLATAMTEADAVVHFRETVTAGGTGYVDEHWYRLNSGLGRLTTARSDGTLCTDATITDLGPFPDDPNGSGLTIGAASVLTGVNYADHTWWTYPGKPWELRAPACTVASPDDLGGYTQLIDIALNFEQIKQDLTNGRLHIVRRGVMVNGQRTVELDDSSGALSSGTAKIWVNETTYRPVRFIGTGKDGSHRQTDYEFLAPTATNLAVLTAPVPPGFRQVAAPKA